MQSPFVGRAPELQAVEELEARVLLGRAAAVVIVGDAGLGKTRLLREAKGRLQLPFVELHGYEPAQEVPLGAAGGLLRKLSAVPEAGERLDALLFGEAGQGTALETVRVFEAAFRCFIRIAPLAVVIDDIQWVDQDTLALLDYLTSAAHGTDAGLLLLAASRPAAEARSLAAALGAALPDGSLTERTLEPLSRDEGRSLVGRLAPDLSDEDAERLWTDAAGSPFWLEALAAGNEPDATPTRLIRSRFASLDADAGQLFGLLVVAAQPLGIPEAASVLGWPDERVERATRVLANRALAVTETGRVRIAHDLIREAAGAAIPDTERRRLHAGLAEWFESGAGDELAPLARALEHRRAAGLPATDLASRLARSPQRRLLGRDGLRMLCEIATEALDEDRAALQREVASLASELGEWESALDQWAPLAHRLPDPVGRARAALAAAHAAVRLERPDEVYVFTARARELAPDDALVSIEADVHEGEALRWLENRVPEARQRTEHAALAAQRMVERAGGADALADDERRAYLAAMRAQVDAAIRAGDADSLARHAEEIVNAAREPADALNATFDGIFGLIMFEGLPRPAEPRARRALDEARRLVLPVIEVEATHWLGWTLHYLGRLGEAEQLTQQTVALAERVGPPHRFGITNLRATAHMVSASRGDWRPAVTDIAAQADLEDDPHYRLNIRMMHLPLLVRFAGRDASGLQPLLDAMADDAAAAGCERCRCQSVLFSAEALSRVGATEAARAALESWDSAQPAPRPGPAARRAYIQALLDAERDPQAGLVAFERAAGLAAGAGQELLGLWIGLDRAAALRHVDRGSAVEALRLAAQQAGEMGALSEQQLAVRSLRQLGVRTWRRGGDGSSLTPREREIARLVVAGDSNPDIAERLFLSRKTVERHVSNILLKVDARNRTELGARLAAEAPTSPDGGGPR